MIVKLHTTGSTNDYLKVLLKSQRPENFTLVQTDHQTHGRGQRGNKWQSEKGKNLIFSIFYKPYKLEAQQAFSLNQAVSLAIFEVLKSHIASVSIKWPNDIMAGHNKIAGILIENTITGQHIKHSIIGVGLNVNQTHFPDGLPQATSMKLETNSKYDLPLLLEEIRQKLIHHLSNIEGDFQDLRDAYQQNLYLLHQESKFQTPDNKIFTGTIQGVNPNGQLLVKKQNGQVESFDFKGLKYLGG